MNRIIKHDPAGGCFVPAATWTTLEQAKAVQASIAAAHARAREQAHAEIAAQTLRLQQERCVWLSQREDELLALAVQLAGQLAGAELNACPGSVRKVAEPLLATLAPRQCVALRLHPRDAQATEAWETLRNANIRIVEDASLDPGDCIIETAHGELDATRKTRVALLHQQLVNRAYEPPGS